MSTQVSGSALLRRIGSRAGVGVWRNRGSVLFGLAAVAAVSGYVAFGTGVPVSSAGAGVAASASSDCADTAMAAIADKSSDAAQQAYQCMDPSFQQRVPETTFVQQIQAQAVQNVNSVARVGDYHSGSGSMVYYAVNADGQSVGYIVYLGQDGKVLRVE